MDTRGRLLASRIRSLVLEGVPPNRICVTSPNNFEVEALCGALSRSGIEILPFWKNHHDLSEMDFDAPKVKVMTAWKAKGLTFDTVFIVGFDRLKNPNEAGLSTLEFEKRHNTAKLCLVAPTRAENRLSIVYSRSNYFLDNLVDRRADLRELRWPDDFEGVS